jgi:hypothetical protein
MVMTIERQDGTYVSVGSDCTSSRGVAEYSSTVLMNSNQPGDDAIQQQQQQQQQENEDEESRAARQCL